MTKLTAKYVNELQQLNMEVNLFMSPLLQKLCASIGIKYVPGSSDNVRLILDTMSLGSAYLTYEKVSSDELADVPPAEWTPPRERMN